MDKAQFNLLPLSEKIELLWNEGEVICERAYYDCNITLFLLQGVYIEVFFRRDDREIIGAEIQCSSEILYGYVNNLDLSQLTNLLH